MHNGNPNPDDTTKQTRNFASRQAQNRPDAGRRGPDPLLYAHRHDSLRRFAELLALRYDMVRTRQAYYRHLRLIGDHFQSDPGSLTEEQLRDYFLHVKTRKAWKPKTIRQSTAAARLFFVDMSGRRDWLVFRRSAPATTTSCPP
jgi:hypothetical protein